MLNEILFYFEKFYVLLENNLRLVKYSVYISQISGREIHI